MDTIINYDKEQNYIGCSPLQHRITGTFYKRCSAINYTAYIHDNLYKFLWYEKYFLSILVSKICFDIIFLFMGIVRSLRKFQVFGVPLTIILFIILIAATPYYLYRVYNK